MRVKDREDLMKRMHFHGFILVDGFFHRHIYTGRNLYSDVVKFDDALNWLENPSITERIRDEDIQVFLTEYDREVKASLSGALIYSSFSGYRDPRLTDEQVSKILSCIKRG
jgi:Ca2+-binding EF-hand superfamily protein